jgi:predicted nucleic acid-binding protein
MRITLDTNQLLRALMRPPDLAVFIMAWEARRFTVAGSHHLLDEYRTVLEYLEVFKYIYPELRRRFLNQLLDQVQVVNITKRSLRLL